MSLTTEDVKQAEFFVKKFPECFIGGSFVVKYLDANDIDILIPWSLWVEKIRDLITPYSEDILGDPRYQVETQLYALREARQMGNLQFLAIRDKFMDAYRGAVDEMKDSPELFMERDARIAVHRRYRQEVIDADNEQEF